MCAIALGFILRTAHHSDVILRSPDERIYTERARLILADGAAAMRPVFHNYVNSTTQGATDPPPTRIGNVWALAGLMELTGARDFSSGSALSLISSILCLFLVALIGLRFLHPWAAAAAVTFQSVSFGALGIARRAWGDGFFGLIGLLIFYLTCEIARRPRQILLYLWFLLAGTVAMLTKETAVLSYGICVLWLLILLVWRERMWKAAALLALGTMLTAGVTLGVWTRIAGDLHSVIAVFRDVRIDSEWGRQNTGGPWWQFAYLLWLTGPLTALMALAGTVIAAYSGWLDLDFDRNTARLAAVIVVCFVLFASLVGHLQYLRIVSPADGAYCLLAGLGMWALLDLARSRMPKREFQALTAAAVFALAVEGIRNYRMYEYAVVRTGMLDLTAIWIRGVLGR